MGASRRIAAGMLAASLMLSGCYGPFRLTRKLHAWNGTAGDKWANEVVFIILVWVPVYGLATLGDALIFNSIEFWTGDNPISTSNADVQDSRTRWVVRDDAKAKISRIANADGDQFVIEQYKGGRKAGSLYLKRAGKSTVAMNDQGKVLFTAESLSDGSILVKDAEGKQVAIRSAGEIRRYAQAFAEQKG